MDFKANQEVRLRPGTARLRQLIKAHGEVWTVLQFKPELQAFGYCPGYFIESKDLKHTRWVLPSQLEAISV